MPSGKTHDAITILLTAPVFAGGYFLTSDIMTASAAAISFLFGGMMFGPDLDTVSKQYSRWGPFRLLWFPYRSAFKHRSRWSHGLIFGTLFRVVYFAGVISILVYLAFVARAAFSDGGPPELSVFAHTLSLFGRYARTEVGTQILIATFAGMWSGAASHTFTDLVGTYIKTGRITEFL